MIGSQMSRPRCSHLKLDDVTTVCLGVCRSVCLSVYACVSLCAQTDRPPTDCGNATSWGEKWTTGRGRMRALNTCDMWRTVPHVMSVNHTVNNEWSMPEHCLVQRSGQFLMLFLWRCRPIYMSWWAVLNRKVIVLMPHSNWIIKHTNGQVRACVSPSLPSQLQC